MHDGARKREKLPLPRREVVAALAHFLIQPLFELPDERGGVHIVAHAHDLLVGDVVAEHDVAADGAREEEHVLQHLPEMTAERRDLDVPDVDAVDEDAALLDIVIAADEREDGGLARARRAHERHRVTRVDVEGNALQDPLARHIGKPDVLKFDLPFHFGKFDRILFIDDFGLHIEHREDLLRRSKRRLQPVELLRKALDGVEELGKIHIEGDDRRARHGIAEEGRAVQIPLAAQIKKAQHRGNVQHIDERTEDTEHEDLLMFGGSKRPILFVELLHLAWLAVEDLRDLYAREIFREEGVDVRRAVLDFAVRPPRELAENEREEHDEGRKAQHHERKFEVQDEHGDEHAENDKHVLDEVDEDVREHHRDGVGIVGDARHQFPHGDEVELGVREPLDVREEVLAQGRKDALARLLQDDGLRIGARERNDKDARIDADEKEEPGKLKLRADDLLDIADEEGRGDVVGDGECHAQPRKQKAPPMRLGIREEAADDLPVLHVAVEADRFLLVFDERIGERKDDGDEPDDAADDDERIILTHCAASPRPRVSEDRPSSCNRDSAR